MTVTPRCRSLSMIAKSTRTSLAASGAVGSSMIMTRASPAIARAISTICCFAGDRRSTRMAGSRSSPYSSKRACAMRQSRRLL